MHRNGFVSTGEASGITNTPATTIRRYIRDFRSFFSEQATRPTPGRRYTENDIKIILLVRHLYFQRYSRSQIDQVLSGELGLPGAESYQVEDLAQLLEKTLAEVEKAKDIYRRIKLSRNNVETTRSEIDSYFERYRKQLQQFSNELTKLQNDVSFVKAGLADTKRW